MIDDASARETIENIDKIERTASDYLRDNPGEIVGDQMVSLLMRIRFEIDLYRARESK